MGSRRRERFRGVVGSGTNEHSRRSTSFGRTKRAATTLVALLLVVSVPLLWATPSSAAFYITGCYEHGAGYGYKAQRQAGYYDYDSKWHFNTLGYVMGAFEPDCDPDYYHDAVEIGPNQWIWRSEAAYWQFKQSGSGMVACDAEYDPGSWNHSLTITTCAYTACAQAYHTHRGWIQGVPDDNAKWLSTPGCSA